RTGLQHLIGWLTAAFIAAFLFSCAATLPPLRPPPEPRSTVPLTDIPISTDNILEAHNLVRRELGIPPLRWSVQMQAYATEWAVFLSKEAGCDLRYRGAIGLPLHRNGLGENLYRHEALVNTDGNRGIDQIDGNTVVVSWLKQAEHYNYIEDTCSVNQRCEGYTQVVWADSAVVGCGGSSCPNRDQIWVCNYDPPGNYDLQRPY
ncbi:MAG: CAP domain-containing protein, partial [Pseudomonadota bacterium]